MVDAEGTAIAQVRDTPRDPALPFVPCRPFGADYFAVAPVRFENTVELDVSREQLFEVFEDPKGWAPWATGISSVEWTSPKPYGPGTTRTVTFWGGVKVYEEFFRYSPDSGRMAFCFYGTTELIWTRFGEDYVVEELPGGRCRLRWTVAYEPAGVFGRIHWLVYPFMALNLRSYMWRLSRYLRRRLPAESTAT